MSGLYFKPKVLIVDDESVVRSTISRITQHLGLSVKEAEDGEKALHMTGSEPFDIVFLDLLLPDMHGLELLRHIREDHPETVVIIVTGHPAVESALESMRLGAMDYLVKPFGTKEVENALSKAREIIVGREEQGEETTDEIIGKSSAMRRLNAKVRRVATTDSTVLITGESGTGKDLVAHKIHDLSPRATNDYVPVDCSALVESLLESELFGHVKGAFTGADGHKAGLFELANKGTFFFDEVSNLSLKTQAKLLRVIQEREFRRVGSQQRQKLDIRIVAASNHDLAKAVQRGTFRNDLYYRIKVVPIHIPPLRERSGDIPVLVEYFLDRYNHRCNREVNGFSEEAMEMMVAYPWPGNVRELKHIIEQILVLEDCDYVRPEHIPPVISQRRGVFNISSENDLPLEEMEKRYIRFVLSRTKGIRQQAADILQINRKTLSAKIKKYGL
jgi:two-component system response regulator AtoC